MLRGIKALWSESSIWKLCWCIRPIRHVQDHMPLLQGVRSHDCILSQAAECKLSSTVSHSSSCCSSKDAYWIGDLPIPLLHRAFATLLLRSLPHPTHIVLPHNSGNRLHFFLLFGPPWSMTTYPIFELPQVIVIDPNAYINIFIISKFELVVHLN